MMEFEILDSAKKEISQAYRKFQSVDPKLADDFWLFFFNRMDTACLTPKLYRVRKHPVRRINLGPQFNEWYIAYMIWGDRIILLALGHAKRKPFYFINRVELAKRQFPLG